MVEKMLTEILPADQVGAVIELKVYLLDSFGSYERIDYGTGIFSIFNYLYDKQQKGHELSFILFLYCLKELGFYTKEDYETVLRNVFYRFFVKKTNKFLILNNFSTKDTSD